MVLSGGRTEPIEKYFEVASELAGRGFAVLMHDWRGQGLSQRLLPERLKGHAAGYHDFLTDYAALIAAFEARLPKPWVAMGHSMGGCLTALALAKGEDRFAAAVLSAPMFGIYTPPLPVAMGRVIAGALTGVGLGGALVAGARLATPPGAVRGQRADPRSAPLRAQRRADRRAPGAGAGPADLGLARLRLRRHRRAAARRLARRRCRRR